MTSWVVQGVYFFVIYMVCTGFGQSEYSGVEVGGVAVLLDPCNLEGWLIFGRDSLYLNVAIPEHGSETTSAVPSSGQSLKISTFSWVLCCPSRLVDVQDNRMDGHRTIN